jgi:hypothetical protein
VFTAGSWDIATGGHTSGRLGIESKKPLRRACGLDVGM